MNLSEERSRQKLLEVLELMGLSEKNGRLAKQYLDMEQPEESGLPAEAEPQDFSGLGKEAREKCRAYISHCRKRNRTEELRRFVQFAAAAGGSTAYYVLVVYGWNINDYAEYLSKEQVAAIQAEGMVWNPYGIKNVISSMGQKSPKVLQDAMKLCYHKSDNAKVLLGALALHYTKPSASAGGVIRMLFPGQKPENTLKMRETAAYVESNLTGSIRNLFVGAALTEKEERLLKEFVQKGSANRPFPQEITRLLRGKQTSEYLVTLLAGAAFLAFEHSDQFAAFLRLAAAMDVEQGRTTTLDICFHIGGESWFFQHIQKLEEQLPVPRESYLAWCLKNCRYGSPVKRMVREHPEVIRQMLSSVSSEDYQYLLSMAKDMNPMLYRELSSTGSGEFRRKIAEELTGRYTRGQAEARQYLLGEISLETLYPYVKEWRGGWDYDTRKYQKLHALKMNQQERQMYRRAVVLEGICMRARYFTSYWHGKYQQIDRATITDILKVWEEEHVPAVYQLEALSAIHDSFYQEKDKNRFINECVQVLCRKKQEWGESFAEQAKAGIVMVRYLCIRVMDVFWQEYKDVLFSCSGDSSKQVRELLTAVYESHPEWEQDVEKLLLSKKSQEREMAVLVLKRWGVKKYETQLQTALEKEKSKKIRELLETCLGLPGGTEEKKEGQTSEDLIKEILKGGKKRKVSWVYEKPFPQTVHKLDQTPASDDYMTAILVCYADMGMPGISREAAKLAADLNPEELAVYVSVLYDRWMESGAEAKKKWVLYAASIHGGEGIIRTLHAQIQEWPKVSRGAMAAEAVKALALNGSSTALLLVDQISRKFKFRQVKTAASEALTLAAEQLGITKAELEDRIVPNLGFDERMEQRFDYGNRTFRVFLNPSLELEVYDDNGKRLKNLPAPGKKDEPEKAKAASDAWKLLKKQLKTVTANQKLRLEQALSAERLWKTDQWTELFVKNPVMHQFAIGLIWGCYENGRLKDTFRYMEDGSFNTVEEEEYELPKDGQIGLVHPVELEETLLAAWKEQLSDYEVVQPVEQLERMVFHPTEEEKMQTELTRFGGKLLNGLSLSGKLQNQGWYRGSVQDAGGYYTFYREDGSVGVELEFSGCFVGDENEEVTVYGAQFYRAGTVQRGSYVYDTVKKENQYRLGEVSPRYFSEIVLQLTKATASSQEQLAYPDCKKM